MNKLPNDFFGRYNTYLSPDKEAQFREWADAAGRKNDLQDYDLRGYFAENGGNLPTGRDVHLTDTYKKPNHPTFSDQSQYHGRDGFYGGSWLPTPDMEKFTYEATPTNTRLNPDLKNYFSKYESENFLKGAK